jgi:ligand-binding sensor domain-containing protein/signal transduction histidine kinase/CheY-like chemotaxis protein/AraC-like DNA-binding protein
MNFIAKYTFLCVFYILNLLVLFGAKAYNPPVRYLGIEQFLSNNAVTSIIQDRHGFMWIGTYNGLNRFDSSNFLVYNNILGDPYSLINNHINRLTEDTAGRIWVGTQKGVVYYSYSDAKFNTINYQSAKSGNKTKVTSNINGFAVAKTGEVYIATDDIGLLIYEAKTGFARQVKFGNKNGDYVIQALLLDEQFRLWLFIKDIGLCIFNKATSQIVVREPSLKTAACLESDHHGNLWIGTEAGLFKYENSHGKLTAVGSPFSRFTSSNILNLHLSKDKLWVATDGGGVNIMDVSTGYINYILPGESEGFLKSGAISDIYEDRESRKWIATLRGGINILDNKLQNFQLVRHDPLNKNSLINNFVMSFCEDEKSNLWIGTDGGGLSFWDSTTKKYHNFYANQNDPGSLSSNFVVSIIRDYTNQIWVATFSGGIDRYDKNTGKFKRYKCYHTEKNVEENNLWKLFEDADHRLWAGTTRGGALYLYNRGKDKFELFDKRLTNIHTLYEDNNGVLWAGDYTRLIRIDIKHKKHEFIPVNNAVRAIQEDKKHNFWIGTEGGGLLLFDRKLKKFKTYTEADGLPGNSVLNLLEDKKGKIWMSTFNGLSVFDPAKNTFRNYAATDGLQSNQFSYNAALKLRSGELLFGGIKGFNRFNPTQISSPRHLIKMRITGLKINNEPIANHLDYLKQGSLVDIRQITVPYNQATLALEYVALEYSFPEKVRYAYFLEGWDRTWNDVGKLKTAYYSRLNPGTYKLKIKATDTEGVWMPPVIIMITILSPWYFTWWAILFYTAVGITILLLIRLNRIRQIRLQYEIQIANAGIEKEKELNEKKLAFFTNISHEFRTPLTLIINPIKDLMNAEDQNGKSELGTIYRNARRLLGLIDQLLLFRRTETENDSLKIVKNNFLALSNDVFACFIQQAKAKNIQYTFHVENEITAGLVSINSTEADFGRLITDNSIIVYGDREKIEIALFNLISNAFNLTPENGRIDVRVKQNGESVFFQISDNGNGIGEDLTEKIFDKLYQNKNNGSLKNGFGVGLYLVKTFTEQHGGKITHTATAGGGLTFRLELLQGTAHFTPRQLSDLSAHGTAFISGRLEEAVSETTVMQEENVPHFELMISNQQTILIIDPNNEIRSYIRNFFKNSYEVFEANDGEEGMLLVRKNLPDIIISDVVMDGLSGIELCWQIKQDTSLSHIPVILLTGDYTPELKLQGIEAGAVDFIPKPFEKDLLIARVNGILKIKSELQHYFYSEITLKTDTRTISEIHKDFLYQCIAVIEGNLQDPDFDVKRISSEMGMSYSSLLKKIKSITGQSVNGFIRFIRLRKSAELMIHTNCNVNEAAMQVGINDIKYFRAQFYKLFEINPSDFIKKHRKAFQKSYHINKR